MSVSGPRQKKLLTIEELARQFAYLHLSESMAMTQIQYVDYCVREVLMLNAALPEPEPERHVRKVAAYFARWATYWDPASKQTCPPRPPRNPHPGTITRGGTDRPLDGQQALF